MREMIVKVDDKGRIVIPKSIRRKLGIKAGDVLFFHYDQWMSCMHIVPAFVETPKE